MTIFKMQLPPSPGTVPNGVAPPENNEKNPEVGEEVQVPQQTEHENPSAAPGEKMVKIDGPVGRVFTDALNQLLVEEGYMTMLPLLEARSEPEPKKDPLLQVYCWTGNSINTEDVKALLNEVSVHPNRDYVVAVENIERVTSAISSLDMLSRLENVKVCYSRDRAVEHVWKKLTS